jgi:hypothetical protein
MRNHVWLIARVLFLALVIAAFAAAAKSGLQPLSWSRGL